MINVSVIIPFYKNINWLSEAIDSVLAQTYTSTEIIVVNDGSPENDNDFLIKYNQYIIYKKINNSGPGTARNVGINIASGKYVAFLDSDDLWLPNKLEKQVALMDDTDAVWSHTGYSTFNENDETRELKSIKVLNYFGNVFPKCLIKLQIATPCVMIKTQYLKDNKFIRFSEKMRHGQDSFMWMLLGAKNELYLCKESLTNVRRNGDNAVLRARIHLKIRAGLYKYLINCFDDFYPGLNINWFILITYKYCYYCNLFLEKLEQSISKKNSENISKVIYLPAYIFFKFSFNYF